MPYIVTHEQFRRNPWVTRKKDTGKIVGKHATKEKAYAQIRALEANEKRQ